MNVAHSQGEAMNAIAQWTDWPVVGKAVVLLLAAAVLILAVAELVDWWRNRRPRPNKPDGPCRCGKCDAGDDSDEEPERPNAMAETYRTLPAGKPERQAGTIDMAEFEELLDSPDAHPLHYGPPIVPGYVDRRARWDRLDQDRREAA